MQKQQKCERKKEKKKEREREEEEMEMQADLGRVRPRSQCDPSHARPRSAHDLGRTRPVSGFFFFFPFDEHIFCDNPGQVATQPVFGFLFFIYFSFFSDEHIFRIAIVIMVFFVVKVRRCKV